MGIENPALLGYELAAAGLPIEQMREWGSPRWRRIRSPSAKPYPAAQRETPVLTHADEAAYRVSSLAAFAGCLRIRARRAGPVAPAWPRAPRRSWCSPWCW